MIKILENNLQSDRIKNIYKSFETVISRLKSVKEDLQFNPNKYDMDILLDILTQIYDDIGDFNIVVGDELFNEWAYLYYPK